MHAVLKADFVDTPVPGRPAEIGDLNIDAVTIARLWDNPCWFAFRFNYLSLRYNIPLYGWIEQEFGLQRPHVAVIYSLGLRNNVTARDIAVSYGFPKNTLSRAVKALEQRGLLRRQRHPTDKRSFILSLTARGRRIFTETLPNFVQLQNEMLKPLTPRERETLSVLLAKIIVQTFSWPESNELPAPAETPPRRRAARA